MDCCFVIVDRATGYVLAIPAALKGLDAQELAEFVLEKCVLFTGVPSEILRDNAKYFNNKFVTTLCNLAGISTHESVSYDHKTNGRAKSTEPIPSRSACGRRAVPLPPLFLPSYPSAVQ